MARLIGAPPGYVGYDEGGQLTEAVAELRQVVALDEQMQHPDLESDQTVLRQVEQEWRESLQ